MNGLRIRPALCLRFTAAPRWAPTPAWVSAATTAAAAAASTPSGTTSFCQQPAAADSRRWSHHQHRKSHAASPASQASRVPAPIPLVPDVATFLSVVGRNMKQHTAKFPTWEALFTLTSPQLKDLGIEPPRDRRYLLRWLQRFREGRFGIGGDFAYVHNGVAELRAQLVVDPADPVKVTKTVLNVPADPAAAEEATEEATEESEGGSAEDAAPPSPPPIEGDPVPIKGYKVTGARAIAGPYALPLKKGTGSQVRVTEGMWEDKRGRKIDGGERRRAEVRFKRKAAERRAEREALGLF